jgi:hypothetical protein
MRCFYGQAMGMTSPGEPRSGRPGGKEIPWARVFPMEITRSPAHVKGPAEQEKDSETVLQPTPRELPVCVPPGASVRVLKIGSYETIIRPR